MSDNPTAARGLPMLSMHWKDVCFAHWRIDAATLQSTLPAGLEVETFEGSAWLSIVPFSMPWVRLVFLPPLPGFTGVPEINLRTYVRCGSERGVWFYSLDAGSGAVVRAARAVTGLPYFDAAIALREDASGEITYRSERDEHAHSPGAFAARYRGIGEPQTARPGTLEAFLHERYRFFTLRGRRLVRGNVRHEPWQASRADIAIERNSLGARIGVALSSTPDACYFSRGVDVVAYAPQRVVPTT